jgi:hypothetical protein
MNFSDRINEDLKKAMLARDEPRMRTLRGIKAQFLLALTEKGAAENLVDEKAVTILQKMVKQRQDSLAIFEQQNRQDLALKEQQELDIIKSYLPEQMTEQELRDALTALISELGATSEKDLGKVMGAATKQFKGKADGKLINTIVRQLLGA